MTHTVPHCRNLSTQCVVCIAADLSTLCSTSCVLRTDCIPSCVARCASQVRDPPEVPAVEGKGMEDAKAAALSWEGHKMRNDSIIVDTFQVS